MATIRDVAREAGVSISTVSIVINGQAAERKIPQVTQAKVFEAIRKVGYQPNLSARKLRATDGDEFTIAVYWAADTRTLLLARFLQGIQRAITAQERNVRIVVHPFTSGKLQNDSALFSLAAYNAAVIATISQTDLDYLEAHRPEIPIVMLNRRSDIFSGVHADNEEAGRLAAMQFLQKGMDDIGAILTKDSFLAMAQRSDGFMRACTEFGVAVGEEKIVYTDDTVASGFGAIEEFRRRGHVPRAIYCDDDIIALGALSGLQRSGFRVPEDIEVIAIGMAPPEFARYAIPPLTVVELPIEDMAQECGNILMDLLERRYDGPRSTHFDVKLYIRESCHPANRRVQ